MIIILSEEARHSRRLIQRGWVDGSSLDHMSMVCFFIVSRGRKWNFWHGNSCFHDFYTTIYLLVGHGSRFQPWFNGGRDGVKLLDKNFVSLRLLGLASSSATFIEFSMFPPSRRERLLDSGDYFTLSNSSRCGCF